MLDTLRPRYSVDRITKPQKSLSAKLVIWASIMSHYPVNETNRITDWLVIRRPDNEAWLYSNSTIAADNSKNFGRTDFSQGVFNLNLFRSRNVVATWYKYFFIKLWKYLIMRITKIFETILQFLLTIQESDTNLT